MTLQKMIELMKKNGWGSLLFKLETDKTEGAVAQDVVRVSADGCEAVDADVEKALAEVVAASADKVETDLGYHQAEVSRLTAKKAASNG